jgi:hypothetical protein
LVERLLCKQDVSGSSPLTSTLLIVYPRNQDNFLKILDSASSPSVGEIGHQRIDSLLDVSIQKEPRKLHREKSKVVVDLLF